MFTGSIEATGALASREGSEDGAVLRIAWSPPEDPLSLGESVAAYAGIDIESVGEGGRASNLKIASQDAARGVDS